MHSHTLSGKELANMILSARDSILSGLQKEGYFVFKNEAIHTLIEHARSEYLALLPLLKLHPQKSKLDRKDLENTPWRKLAIGATNGVGEPYALFNLKAGF